ncbi:MAG: lipase family protein [Massilia sp.]
MTTANELPRTALVRALGFDSTPLNIDYALTYQLAELALTAYYVAGYDDPTFVNGVSRLEGGRTEYAGRADWLTKNGFTPIVNPDGVDPMDKNWGIATVVDNVLILAFRGTNSSSDVAIDLGEWSVGLGGSYVRVDPWQVQHNGTSTTVLAHHMFLQTYLKLAPNVKRYVQSKYAAGAGPRAIWIVGHSLGGALANLCALDLGASLGAGYPVPKAMSFGAPYVGDQTFATLFNALVPDATRFALTWDTVTMNPMYGMVPGSSTYPPYVHAGTKVALTGPDWVQHMMQGYYWAIATSQPNHIQTGFLPDEPVTSLVLQIKTADTIGSGTDADISVNIMGVQWGVLDLPWQTDFGRGDYDTYDLFALFPGKVPSGATVKDIVSIKFAMSGINNINMYTCTWKLEYVDIRVNSRPFCRVPFNALIGPGEESGMAAQRTISL